MNRKINLSLLMEYNPGKFILEHRVVSNENAFVHARQDVLYDVNRRLPSSPLRE